MKKGLLIGIRTEHVAKLAQKLQPEQAECRIAITLDEAERIFAQETIDLVFIGCGHDSERRLKMLAHVFAVSPSSEIHIMGCKSDPIAFITGILYSVES
jgi:predicted aconitase